MSKTLAAELEEAKALAATANVLAITALVILAITIATQLGTRIGVGVFGHATGWREWVHDVGLTLISLIPTFLFYEAVNRLRRALQLYSAGEFFSAAAASKVAQAGDYAIAAIAAIILVVPNLTLWVTQRGGFDLRFESEFIGMLAFAFFVSAVGRILAAATQLKSENDAFV